jgi:adenosylcobinamide-phosphate synthase
MDLTLLAPHPVLLACAVVLDLLVGDPVYPFHPVRLMGHTITALERLLRAVRLDGYLGGVLLFLVVSVLWVVAGSVLISASALLWKPAAWVLHVLLVYSLLALRDLLVHASAVQRAANANDLIGAREAIARLVGRDTAMMDLAACRRAAIESLAENLTDGFISLVFWYTIGGIPALVLFKAVSTMDSMVGYKTPLYLRFGWCGARTDDLMNLLPARFTWLMIALIACFVPGCSARKALLVGWQQHSVVPGPNSGWSEAAMAGAIQRRLIGPIWSRGVLVANVWLGLPSDPEAGTARDLQRAVIITLVCGLLTASGASFLLAACYPRTL